MKDIMRRIASVPGGRGFFYWEPGWIPVPGCGWATDAALAYTGRCLILTAMRCLHSPPSGISMWDRVFCEYIFSLVRQPEASQRRLTM